MDLMATYKSGELFPERDYSLSCSSDSSEDNTSKTSISNVFYYFESLLEGLCYAFMEPQRWRYWRHVFGKEKRKEKLRKGKVG
jgi:hypothetical protein